MNNLSKLSIERLDLMFAALPIGNVFKDDVAAEIESRVSAGDVNMSPSDKVLAAREPNDIEKALQILQLS